MRIAVVSNTAWYLYNFRLTLMQELRDAGHTVVAIAPHDNYVQHIVAGGINVFDVAISGEGTNPLVEIGSIYSLWKILHQQKIELVLSYTPKGNLYAALGCLASRIDFVPTVSGLGRAFIHRSLVTWVAKFLYHLTFRHAYHVFFENNDDLNLFAKEGFVNKENCERLPGAGINLERFKPSIPPERPRFSAVFLLVARMLRDKGVIEYVEAAQAIRLTHPQVCFRLLGFVDVANPSAITRSEIDQWAANGWIEYQGVTDDVRPFLDDADCVVLPSYREGVPRTLLEAAAMARPIVTTDAPGCRDTILNGVTGFLCRVADASDLTDKLRQFLDLPISERASMGQRGREFVAEHFDEKLVLARYLDTVTSLAHTRLNSSTSSTPPPRSRTGT